MRRSKLFIYGSAGLLVLVAVAATKMHQANVTGHYDFFGTGHCTNAAPTVCTNTATILPCTYLWDPGHPMQTNYALYTYNSEQCTNQVFYDPSCAVHRGL